MQNKWPRIPFRRQDEQQRRVQHRLSGHQGFPFSTQRPVVDPRQPNDPTSHQNGQVQVQGRASAAVHGLVSSRQLSDQTTPSMANQIGQVQVQGRASAAVHGLVSSRQLSDQTTPSMANQIGQVQHFFFRHEVYQRRVADNKSASNRHRLQRQQPRRVIGPEEDEAAEEVHAQPRLKRRRIEKLANVTPLGSSTANFAAAAQIVLIKDIQRHFALLEEKKKLCKKYLHNFRQLLSTLEKL
uniref:Uncharacterized protein n=1 Tax=Globodera pallida TaxID=36090 RepID=A0A183BSJ6_GLOPA